VCVAGERGTIARPDPIGEELEVAAHMEDARKPRSNDDVADRRIEFDGIVLEHAFDRALYLGEIAQEAVGEIRHTVRREVTPEDLVLQVERDLEVLVRSRRKASLAVGGVRRSGSAPCRLRQIAGNDAKRVSP